MQGPPLQQRNRIVTTLPAFISQQICNFAKRLNNNAVNYNKI
jgi:hypothetical protein